MQLTLYNNSAEANKLDKTASLKVITEMSGTLRQTTSLINPSIIIELDPKNIEMTPEMFRRVASDNKLVLDEDNNQIVYRYIQIILNSNYAYIKEFGRYYFISDIVSINNNLWMINMHVDVLMTYRENILEQQAYVARNQYDYLDDLIDTELVTSASSYIDFIEIPTKLFDDYAPASHPYLFRNYVCTLIQKGVIK